MDYLKMSKSSKIFLYLSLLFLVLQLKMRLIRSDEVVLTEKNYDEMTKDKAIMIRFVTNWCEDCYETKEDWEKLAKDWQGHPIGLVAEVFCDVDEGEGICDEYEVAGYPSVYWGDPESPEIYKGKLDYESLSEFAKENISSLPCSVKNFDVCEESIKKIITNLRSQKKDELEELEKEVIRKVQEEHTKFDKKALQLQKQYEELAKSFNTKIDELRDRSGFKWIQQVLTEMDTLNEDLADSDIEKDEL